MKNLCELWIKMLGVVQGRSLPCLIQVYPGEVKVIAKNPKSVGS